MNNNNIFISFCIPTYNRSNYLDKCIQSIIGYQGDDIEIIIQDNDSADDTEQVVKNYSDYRIRYFKNDTNIGLTRNFSAVISNASGKYVYLLTDDDLLIPGSVNLIKDYINKHKFKAFKTALIMFLEKSNGTFIYSFTNDDITRGNISVQANASALMYSHIFTGICFERSLFDINFIKLHYGNWYPSIALMGCAGRDIGFMSKPTAIHIWENETFWGIMPDNAVELNRGLIAIYKSLKKEEKIDQEMYFELCRQYALSHLNRDNQDLYEDLPTDVSNVIRHQVKKAKNYETFKTYLKMLKRALLKMK